MNRNKTFLAKFVNVVESFCTVKHAGPNQNCKNASKAMGTSLGAV